MLTRSRQFVPPELQQIAAEVKSGKRVDLWKKWEDEKAGNTWNNNDWKDKSDWKSGANDWKSSADDKWKSQGGSDWKTTSWKKDESKETTGDTGSMQLLLQRAAQNAQAPAYSHTHLPTYSAAYLPQDGGWDA